ncbi:hypothetical protein GQ44DRAFT_829091 [Phaeosphaeriaceae sp. PMI808]|nr:hypothetical protein GQ44DRAFT_829091 [Phaeosphaeriaceae sp. PMI808]
MSVFHIRDEALPEDADFILEAFDSTLPHLATIGSGAQWGSEPRSTEESSVERIRVAVEKARSSSSDNHAIFVAEVPIEDGLDPVAGRTRRDNANQQMLQVGAAVIKGSFPVYVAEQKHLDAHVRAAIERADYIYLDTMISDFRTGALRKGSGAALVRRVRQYGLEKRKAAVYVDCWAGNGERLVGFYKSQGFVPIGDFQVEKDDGSQWPAKLLRMDIEEIPQADEKRALYQFLRNDFSNAYLEDEKHEKGQTQTYWCHPYCWEFVNVLGKDRVTSERLIRFTQSSMRLFFLPGRLDSDSDSVVTGVVPRSTLSDKEFGELFWKIESLPAELQ